MQIHSHPAGRALRRTLPQSLPPPPMAQSAQVTINKIPHTGWLIKNSNVSLTVLKAACQRCYLSSWVGGEDALLGHQRPTSCCVRTGKSRGSRSRVSFITELIPDKGSTLTTCDPPKALPPHSITLWHFVSTYELGETYTFRQHLPKSEC